MQAMSQSMMQHTCSMKPCSSHTVSHAAVHGLRTRPFVHSGTRLTKPFRKDRGMSTVTQAKDVEIVLKADEGDQPLKEVFAVEDNVELQSLPFSKPLGAVMAEQKGKIVVERIIDGSNAALGGLQIGDVIRGTTARSQVDAKVVRPGSGSQAKQDYWGAQILVNADGQDFDTFMAALNSSRCENCDVMLIVERQKGAESKVSPQSPVSSSAK